MLNSDEKNYGLISFQLEFKQIQYTKKIFLIIFNQMKMKKTCITVLEEF